MIKRKQVIMIGEVAEKSNDIPCKSAINVERADERGAAMIVALILIATFIFLATAASRTVSAISAEAQKIEQTRQEAARAEYYVSMAEATLKYDVRRVYNDYQIRGKQNELRLGGDGTLPMFDPLAVTDSRPLLNLDGGHSGENPRTATSLYGRLSSWSEQALVVSRTYLDSKVEEKQLIFPESVEIKSFTEAFRRTMQGETEPIYALRYTVRATSGEFAEIVREDTVLLGPVLNEDNPVLVNCSDLELTGAANPANVVWGNPTRLDLNYIRAERLVIYNQSGSIVYNQAVADETTPRSINFDTNPLTSPTVFIGEAVRGTCQIQVPITVGVTFSQNISYTVNGSQSINIIEGENVRYDWNISDASSGFTTSHITYGNDATPYFENIYSNSLNQLGPAVSTISVLHVRDTRYANGAEQTATVNITVCRLPRVSSFTVSPPTVNEGGNQTIRFDWQTQFAASVRIVRVSDGQILHVSNNAGSGFWSMSQPTITTEYRIEALSDCGAPMSTAQAQVTVTSNPTCPPPVINSFTANPSLVYAGGNQNVQLGWSLSGTTDSVTISNLGSVTGNSINITQPQTTTVYILTVSGCAQTVQSSATVTVQNTPVVQHTSREITLGSGLFGCETGNQIRAMAGLPLIPCIKWTVEDNFSLDIQPDGSYMLTFSSVGNADNHPWFRSKRRPSVQIGVFGDVAPGPCVESILNPMCYENRYQYSFFADYGAFDNTPDIRPVIFPNVPTADNTYKFRILLAPNAKKVVIREVGSGSNFYTIYYPGFDFGPGDRFPEDEYNYGYPVNSSFPEAVFDVPQ